jgi:hypothetical protein
MSDIKARGSLHGVFDCSFGDNINLLAYLRGWMKIKIILDMNRRYSILPNAKIPWKKRYERIQTPNRRIPKGH